jgi:hypothetical protein
MLALSLSPALALDLHAFETPSTFSIEFVDAA